MLLPNENQQTDSGGQLVAYNPAQQTAVELEERSSPKVVNARQLGGEHKWDTMEQVDMITNDECWPLFSKLVIPEAS